MRVAVSVSNVDSLRNDLGTALFFFHAPWCASCRSIMPVLNEFSDAHQDIRVCDCDINDEPDLAGRFSVSSLPCFILFRDGVLVDQRNGVMSFRDLEKFVA